MVAGSLAEGSDALRVAVYGAPAPCARLRRVLELNGAEVVLERTLREGASAPLAGDQADVLLVELCCSEEADAVGLDQLLERVGVPVLFHDAAALGRDTIELRRQGRRLLSKLSGLVAPPPREAPPPLRLVEDDTVRNVWVLGASIGGPPVVKEFLAALPEGIPAAFILAQHIGGNFVSLLAEQLDRACSLRVDVARDGQCLRHGEVLLVPVGSAIGFDDDGRVQLRPADPALAYAPSIDATMTAVAGRFGSAVGAVLFSGMGRDGVVGVRAVADGGGVVWCQEASTCVVSSMVDAAGELGLVDLSDSAAALAAALEARLVS